LGVAVGRLHGLSLRPNSKVTLNEFVQETSGEICQRIEELSGKYKLDEHGPVRFVDGLLRQDFARHVDDIDIVSN